MAHHVEYPTAFPSECISELIQIIRGGTAQILARRAEVGLHAWNVQGFAQSVLLGSPDGPFHALSPDQESELASQLNEVNALVAANHGGTYAAAIDWRAALKFFIENVLPILLPLILKEEQPA